jgi:L-ascorbate metabolism protein UlaG (beta-lactamase superfamily)
MGMEGAAFAARKYFDFKTVIPCHYKTFPILSQSAQPLIDALPDVNVLTPDPMDIVEI